MAANAIRVLLIQDNQPDAALILERLSEIKNVTFQVCHAHKMSAGLDRLRAGGVDAVVLDIATQDGEGLSGLARIKALAPGVPVVIVATNDDPALAVTAVQAGAQNFLLKGSLTKASLARALRYPIEMVRRRAFEQVVRANDEQFRAARQIQQRLYPTRSPNLPGFDIGGVGYPAQATGGDYFDYIAHPAGFVDIVIGDVSGHGFGPALLMAETRAYLRAFVRVHSDVGEILSLVNEVMLEDTEEDRFVTLLLARLNPRTRSFEYASAGHPAGYVLTPTGAVHQMLESTARPLGLFHDLQFPSSSVELQPGEIVLLTTDGITDARAPDDKTFGMERVLDLVREHVAQPAEEIAKALCERVNEFCRDDPNRDDITAIVLKVLAPAHVPRRRKSALCSSPASMLATTPDDWRARGVSSMPVLVSSRKNGPTKEPLPLTNAQIAAKLMEVAHLLENQ